MFKQKMFAKDGPAIWRKNEKKNVDNKKSSR